MVLLASAYDKSRFLKADDFDGEKKFRIKAVTEEEVGERKERKLVVWFTNDERGLVLNKVNNRVLRGAFGDDTTAWAGKIIIIFSTLVDMRGRMVKGLRTRIPPPKQAQAGNGARPVTKPVLVTAPAPEPVVADDPELMDDPKPTLAEELNDEIDF
jgi:hypothetical protein